MMELREAFWRERFYRFERAARALFEPPALADLPAGALRQLAEQAFDTLGCYAPPLTLVFAAGRDAGLCCWDGEQFTIWLPPGRQRPWCLLHEVAHAANMAEGHDPCFAERCLGLWMRLSGWPSAELRRLAILHGFGDEADCDRSSTWATIIL